MGEKEYLTQDEVSKLTGVAKGTLENWRVKKIGPPYLKLGRSVRYKLSDLNEWLASREMKTDFCLA